MQSTAELARHYRTLLERHGDHPLSLQMSRGGQEYRFRKLLEIADLDGCSVLDVGCGLGDFYPALRARFPNARYHGIDLVPEMAAAASAKHPEISFRAIDLLQCSIPDRFDWVVLSGVFNNAMPDADDYLESLLSRAWELAVRGLGFNFISSHVNFVDESMAYHAPDRVLAYCLEKLSRRVAMHHHYDRCDVAVFVYR